jgi:hypothetical protein
VKSKEDRTGRLGMQVSVVLGFDMEPDELAQACRHQPAAKRETGKGP